MERILRLGLIWLLAGLMIGPRAVVAAPPTDESVIHVVAWGDTVFSIARRYETTVDAVVAANSLSDPTQIYAGQRLVIPTTATPAPSDATGAGATHVVRPGENLFRIALQYGTTIQAMAELNGLQNPGHVTVGQTLRIPGSASEPTPAYQPDHATTTHTVARGETLVAIAQRYGISTWTLISANNIANPSLIVPGQVLSIPNRESLVTPPADDAPPVTAGKRILIDISEQHLYAYQGEELVYSFVASTGSGNSTRTGTFQVLDKIPNAYASTWDLQMPHWLGIYWAGSLENGIHALPILSNGQRLWDGYLGTPVSYGCIILGVEEARMLYNWAEVGVPVVIQR